MWVLIPTLLAPTVALLLTDRQTPIYQASAEVGLDPSIKDNLVQGAALPTRTVAEEIRVAQSTAVRQAVSDRLGYAPAVSVEPVGVGQATFQVATRMSDPVMAAHAANAFAEAYITFRRDRAIADLQAAEAQLEQKVAELQVEIDEIIGRIEEYPVSQRPFAEQNFGSQRSLLVNEQGAFRHQLDQLRVAKALRTSGVTLLQSATVPTSPVEPNVTRNFVIAVTLGLVVGLLCAFAVGYRLQDSRT